MPILFLECLEERKFFSIHPSFPWPSTAASKETAPNMHADPVYHAVALKLAHRVEFAELRAARLGGAAPAAVRSARSG